jgi:ABC-type lipoprotein export system ATPase subunit
MALIVTEALRHSYRAGRGLLWALDGINLTIERGEFVAIMGPSGSGKSTFMNILGCLDTPTAGQYYLDGLNVRDLDRDALAAVRNRSIGFVFQSFNLLPRTTALENVEVPLLYRRMRTAERRRRVLALLDDVGLSDRADHTPAGLSGGEQQRVAIARALINEPLVLLADEPTGALDTQTSREIMAIFQRLNYEHRLTIVLVTHEAEIAAQAGRVVTFRDGRMVADESCLPHSSPMPSVGFGLEGLVGWDQRHLICEGAPPVMDLNFHANATTTPKISGAPVAVLADELGVSETTIRQSRSPTTILDRPQTPRRLAISLSPVEETLVCELRSRLWLPLDDITEVMRRCVNTKLSRSAIQRCLVQHGLNQRPKPDKPLIGMFEQASVGFIRVDLKHLPAMEKRKSYAFMAIDRATRYVYLEIHPKREAGTAAEFLERCLAHLPQRVHTILTNNGSEFTDRFAVDMKDKPHDRPSGRHLFDRVCAKHSIDHRLTKPFRPRPNGPVERFNRHIVESTERQPKRGIAHQLFASQAERDAFLLNFVHDYNRTRLKCLGYLTPLQALASAPAPNIVANPSLSHALR